MRAEVRMPRLGYDMESGRIGRWLKRIGDRVERGEALVEIETEKTTVEMESLAAGTLAEIVAAEGTDIAVGEVIAYLD